MLSERRNYRKIVLLLAAIVLALTACGTASTQKSNDSGKDAASADTGAANKKFTIEYDRMFANALNEPPIAENPVKQQIQNDLNIDYKVTVNPGGYSAWEKKFATRIAVGDDLPDVVWLNQADVAKYAQEGIIIPLDDLLAKVPGSKDLRTDDQWGLSKVNGKIYAVPNVNAGGSQVGSYIRKDWLDKLNLKVPTTTDELYNVLMAFTFNDPDGNNKNDTYGYTGPNFDNVAFSMLANAFGLPQVSVSEAGLPEDWIDSKGVLHFGAISDQYKDYLMYMNKLATAKVLDPDLISNTMPIVQQKVTQGQVGMMVIPNPSSWMTESSPKMLSAIKKADPKANWVYMKPVKGPTGLSGNNSDAPSAAWYIALTKHATSEPGKAERALQLIQYVDLSDGGGKGHLLMDAGLKGIHHEESPNGEVTKLLPLLATDRKNFMDAYRMSTVNPDKINQQILYSKEDGEQFMSILGDNSKGYKIASSYYKTPISFVYDGAKYIQEMSLKFIYGKEDFSKWNDYVNTLNDRYKFKDVQALRKKDLQDAGVLK